MLESYEGEGPYPEWGSVSHAYSKATWPSPALNMALRWRLDDKHSENRVFRIEPTSTTDRKVWPLEMAPVDAKEDNRWMTGHE
jgi:hypothetical protein